MHMSSRPIDSGGGPTLVIGGLQTRFEAVVTRTEQYRPYRSNPIKTWVQVSGRRRFRSTGNTFRAEDLERDMEVVRESFATRTGIARASRFSKWSCYEVGTSISS